METTIRLNKTQTRRSATQVGIDIAKKWLILMALVILVVTTSTAIIVAVNPSGSLTTYEYLVDGTFENGNEASRFTEIVKRVSSQILGVVLPFMSYLGLTNIVISMSATVIYLSKPDYFDEVHEEHRKRQESKDSRRGLKGMATTVQGFANGTGAKFFKGYVIPDVKEWAFHEACEIGEDGRPSLSTFFKYNFPKFAVIIAVIIMVNDRTMLDLMFQAAGVGVFFFQKAAYEYDYPAQIQKFLNTGSGYDPKLKGGKKNIYNKLNKAALGIDKSPGTEKAEYKQMVGQRIYTKLEAEVFPNYDFETQKVASTVRIEVTPNPQLGNNPNLYQWPVGDFSVDTGTTAQYLTLEIDTEQRNLDKQLESSGKTTYPAAWGTVTSTGVTVDMSKTEWGAGESKDASGNVIKGTKNLTPKGQAQVAFEGGQTTGSIVKNGDTFQITYAAGKEPYKVSFAFQTPQGTRHMVYVNRELMNKVLNKPKETNPKK